MPPRRTTQATTSSPPPPQPTPPPITAVTPAIAGSESSYRTRAPSPTLSTSSYLSIEDSLPSSTSSQALLVSSHHHHHPPPPHHHHHHHHHRGMISHLVEDGHGATRHIEQDEEEGESFSSSLEDSLMSQSANHGRAGVVGGVGGEEEETDSLIDASEEQVERIALQFLADDDDDDEGDDGEASFNLQTNPKLPISIGAANSPRSTSTISTMRAQDLPRPVHHYHSKEHQEQALSFLRQELNGLKDVEWIQDVPSGFETRSIKDPKKETANKGFASGRNGNNWLDQKFNLESY